MLLSRDFRKIARENLRGRWFPAIVVGFLGGLLGAVMDVSYSTEIFTQTGTSNTDLVDQLKNAGVYDTVLPVFMGIGITVLVMALIHIVIGGAVTLGYPQTLGRFLYAVLPRHDGYALVHPVCDSRIYCFVSICYDTLYYGRK